MWHVILFEYIIYLKSEVFEFIMFIFCFQVECWLFHHRFTNFGFCILCSFMPCAVFCSGLSHGLYHCPSCFSHCLHYCFSDICLLSYHLLYFYFSASIIAYVCLFETLLMTPCSVSCLSEDSTSWCLYLPLLLLCEFIWISSIICACLYIQW